VVASLPLASEIVLPALQHFDDLNLRIANTYGYKATFNSTFPSESTNAPGWVSPWHLGLNQGPIVLMIENYRSGLLWRLLRQCPPSRRQQPCELLALVFMNRPGGSQLAGVPSYLA
jgi:hypothetical protein